MISAPRCDGRHSADEDARRPALRIIRRSADRGLTNEGLGKGRSLAATRAGFEGADEVMLTLGHNSFKATLDQWAHALQT